MTDTIQPKTNGNGEQARREQEFASWLAKQSTERDESVAESARVKAENVGLRVTIEALQAQLSDADSKAQTAMLLRDDAVARRAAVETVLASMMALGRAFQIQNEPLVREIPEDEVPTIGGA